MVSVIIQQITEPIYHERDPCAFTHDKKSDEPMVTEELPFLRKLFAYAAQGLWCYTKIGRDLVLRYLFDKSRIGPDEGKVALFG